MSPLVIETRVAGGVGLAADEAVRVLDGKRVLDGVDLHGAARGRVRMPLGPASAAITIAPSGRRRRPDDPVPR